jgi:coatomer protein complex subunit gamma|tara:strand:- start:3120 stop:3521 length:402 start_codon:yes stop_codon:yes gene_type:complete
MGTSYLHSARSVSNHASVPFLSHPNISLKVWDALPAEDEKVDEYSLGSRDSLDEALEAVLGILGLHACEGSELIPTSARSHTTLLSGFFVGDHSVLVQLNMGMGSSNSVAMKLVVRADQPHIAEMFHTLVSEA